MLAIVQRHGLTVKQIVITHAHIDHIGGAAKLKRATGAPVLPQRQRSGLLKMLDVQASWVGMRPPETATIDAGLNAGDKLQAGSLRGRCTRTPPVTPRVAFAFTLPAEKKLIAGDTLFAGSIGRTDLPGGSFKKIMESLHGPVLRPARRNHCRSWTRPADHHRRRARDQSIPRWLSVRAILA